jgi:hypothetical protein
VLKFSDLKIIMGENHAIVKVKFYFTAPRPLIPVRA